MCLLFENEHVGAKQENTKRKEKTKKMKRKKPNNFDVSNESFFNCEFVIPHLKLSIGTFSHKQQTNCDLTMNWDRGQNLQLL